MPSGKVLKKIIFRIGLPEYSNILIAKLAITHRAVTSRTFRYNRKAGHYIDAAKTFPL